MQFTGEGGYYLNVLSDRSKTIFCSAGLSAPAGYETIRHNKHPLPDGATINNKYAFDVQAMPYPKKVVKGETVELRLQIVKEGNYTGTKFFIRYFQTDVKGELKLDDGTVLTPNDLFPLAKETFRLYYTSGCTDQQNFDVYIEDNFGQVVQKSFSLSNESKEKEE
jgi:hypothetical protein